MVSGVVALMLAAHPDWGPDEVRQALVTGADDLEPAGRDLFTGAGLVRADRGW
jgi:subtilisin family serine protease